MKTYPGWVSVLWGVLLVQGACGDDAEGPEPGEEADAAAGSGGNSGRSGSGGAGRGGQSGAAGVTAADAGVAGVAGVAGAPDGGLRDGGPADGAIDGGTATDGGAEAGAPMDAPPAPAGKVFLFAQSGSSRIVGFSLDASTGALTHASTFDNAEAQPLYLATNPKAPMIVAAANERNNVTAYLVDGMGALTKKNSVTTGGAPVYVDVHPAGSFAATGNYGGSTTIVRLDPTGSASAPKTLLTGKETHSAKFHPAGGFLYSLSKGEKKVSQYSVSADGDVIVLEPPQVETPKSAPRHMAILADGSYAFVINERTWPDGNDKPHDVDVTSYKITDGKLSVAGNNVTALSVNPPRINAGEDVAGAEIRLHPSQKWLFASVRDQKAPNTPRNQNLVVVFAVKAGGVLERKGHITTGKVPEGFAIDPSGRWLVVAEKAAGRFTVHEINASTGALTSRGTVTHADLKADVVGITFVQVP